jgi:hypothetical protein
MATVRARKPRTRSRPKWSLPPDADGVTVAGNVRHPTFQRLAVWAIMGAPGENVHPDPRPWVSSIPLSSDRGRSTEKPWLPFV